MGPKLPEIIERGVNIFDVWQSFVIASVRRFLVVLLTIAAFGCYILLHFYSAVLALDLVIRAIGFIIKLNVYVKGGGCIFRLYNFVIWIWLFLRFVLKIAHI